MMMMMLGLVLVSWASERMARPASPSACLHSVCCRWMGWGRVVGMGCVVAIQSRYSHDSQRYHRKLTRVRCLSLRSEQQPASNARPSKVPFVSGSK